MTAGLASTIGRIDLSWVRIEIAFLVGALMMGA